MRFLTSFGMTVSFWVLGREEAAIQMRFKFIWQGIHESPLLPSILLYNQALSSRVKRGISLSLIRK